MPKDSDRKEIRRILNRMVAKPSRAILGDGGGTVQVPGKTGWLWVRRLGNEEVVFQAYNRSISDPAEGQTVLVQESRIEGLSGYEIVGKAGGDTTASDALLIHIADSAGSGEDVPYGSTAWDGDSYSTGNGTINWETAFGMPVQPRFVFLSVLVRDSGSVGTRCVIAFRAKSTTTYFSGQAEADSGVNDRIRTTPVEVAVSPDGTTAYTTVASGASTLDVWIYVVAYLA